MIYIFDIDGTICTITYGDYDDAKPFLDRIEENNKLYDEGHTIIYHTARGMGRTNNNVVQSYKLFYDYTVRQFDSWGVKFHDLFIGKPNGDVYVDDKGIKDIDFYNNVETKTIFVNGCFDVLHCGHIKLFKYAKSLGDKLIVAVDADKKVKEFKGNNRPVNRLQDRVELLRSIRFIDEVLSFDTKKKLEQIIEKINPDVLVVGSDWQGKEVVGSKYAKEVRFFERIDGYSTTQILQDFINR